MLFIVLKTEYHIKSMMVRVSKGSISTLGLGKLNVLIMPIRNVIIDTPIQLKNTWRFYPITRNPFMLSLPRFITFSNLNLIYFKIDFRSPKLPRALIHMATYYILIETSLLIHKLIGKSCQQ